MTWANVDLEAGKVRVVGGLQRVRDADGSRLAMLGGKTDRARREIVLPAIAAERLRRWRTEQNTRRLALGVAWVDDDLVCDRGDGGPLDPDAFSNGFKRMARLAGLDPTTRLHDVRHGVATALLDRGVHPAITSAVLGHSNVGFTMNTYQHVLDGMTAVAASELNQALGG
jgi:integrase